MQRSWCDSAMVANCLVKYWLFKMWLFTMFTNTLWIVASNSDVNTSTILDPELMKDKTKKAAVSVFFILCVPKNGLGFFTSQKIPEKINNILGLWLELLYLRNKN